ncbi:MAG: hypothetical protein ACTIDN_01810 [Acetobacter sp.]|uniref:hypothetical protein n=1 Tax=Acetobacter sp. TaxID=440 RepID=UPI003F8DD5D1
MVSRLVGFHSPDLYTLFLHLPTPARYGGVSATAYAGRETDGSAGEVVCSRGEWGPEVVL